MRVFIYVILATFLYGCNTYVDKEIKNNYDEILGLYPTELVSSFPELKYSDKMLYCDLLYPKGKYLSYIHLMIKYPNHKEIEKIKNYAESNATKKYYFNDSCQMIIKYNEEMYQSAPFKFRMCESVSNELLPIPNFKFCIDNNYPSSFYENATIYVLNAEKGKFLKDDALSISGVGFPKEWDHGYSKGILISNDLVLYWLEVW